MDGYPNPARLIGSRPELGIFRVFGGLGALNILYMQMELVYLEKELEKGSTIDAQPQDTNRKANQSSWELLREGGDIHLLEVLGVREKLKEYSEQSREI